MKQVLVICDGMADEPIDTLGGKTPLEAAATPALDKLANLGLTGSIRTIPDGKYPGSEVGIMAILGYKSEELPIGRGPLEAIGLGIEMSAEDIAMRYTLKKPEEFTLYDLQNRITSGKICPLTDTTGLYITTDQDSVRINNDYIKFWSADRVRNYASFNNLHNTSSAVIIGAVPLLKGIAKAIGAEWIKPEGATGDIFTDYRAKGAAAINALETYDIVIVHVEACDWASHNQDPVAKVKAIENIDRDIIYPLLNFLDDIYLSDSDILRDYTANISISIMSDHPSLCTTGNHTSGPSPFLYYYPHFIPDSTQYFSEREAVKGELKSIEEIWQRILY